MRKLCPLIADDAGDATSAARPLAVPAAPGSVTSDGLLGPGDVDYYSFSAAAGQSVRVTLQLTPPSPWNNLGRTNLDAEVDLLGPGGALIANWTNEYGVLSGTLQPRPLPASVRCRPCCCLAAVLVAAGARARPRCGRRPARACAQPPLDPAGPPRAPPRRRRRCCKRLTRPPPRAAAARPQGTYYLSIRGTGQGGSDPYSSYGSMGPYRLNVALGGELPGVNWRRPASGRRAAVPRAPRVEARARGPGPGPRARAGEGRKHGLHCETKAIRSAAGAPAGLPPTSRSLIKLSGRLPTLLPTPSHPPPPRRAQCSTPALSSGAATRRPPPGRRSSARCATCSHRMCRR